MRRSRRHTYEEEQKEYIQYEQEQGEYIRAGAGEIHTSRCRRNAYEEQEEYKWAAEEEKN